MAVFSRSCNDLAFAQQRPRASRPSTSQKAFFFDLTPDTLVVIDQDAAVSVYDHPLMSVWKSQLSASPPTQNKSSK